MIFNDLRGFITEVKSLNDCKIIEDADWNLEIGAITEWQISIPDNPLLWFKNIKGYPPEYSIVTNVFGTPGRTALALGLDGIQNGQPVFAPDIAVIENLGNIGVAIPAMILVRVVNGSIVVLHPEGDTRKVMILEYRHADQRIDFLRHDVGKARANLSADLDLSLIAPTHTLRVRTATLNIATRPVELEARPIQLHIETIPDDDVVCLHTRS